MSEPSSSSSSSQHYIIHAIVNRQPSNPTMGCTNHHRINCSLDPFGNSTDDETAKLIDRYKLLCNYNVTRNEHISSTSNCSRISSI
eukprot:scaffold931_cov200-Alexandrium_tamarense.AAC.5